MTLGDFDFANCNQTVAYTEEYVRKTVIVTYTQEEAQHTFDALELAFSAHNNRRRCNDAPYIIHPIRVALMLLKFDNDTISKVFIAALLHDILEKTDVPYWEIEERFGRYVAKLVQSLTRKHDDRQSLQEKIEAKRQNWLEIMSSSHETRMIRICEDLDNMYCWRTLLEDNPASKKIPRWLAEAQQMSLPLARTTNKQVYDVMRQECEFYVERGFGYQPITI